MSRGPVVETYAGVTRVSRWIWNCYVLHEGPVVVDAGQPGVADDLEPVLRELGCAGVAAVVATHGHSDHLGGAPEVARRFGAEVHLPQPTLAYVGGAPARNPGPLDQARVLPVLRDQPADPAAVRGLVAGTRIAGFGLSPRMRWTGPAPAGGLDDGDPVPGAPSWQVVAAPGHTDDSIALWHPITGTLLSGDAVLTRRGRAWSTPEVVDRRLADRSDAVLRGLPVRALLPGHGVPLLRADIWEAPRPRVRARRRQVRPIGATCASSSVTRSAGSTPMSSPRRPPET